MPDYKSIPELTDVTSRQFVSEIYPAQKPVVLRGVAENWPSVQAAQTSDQALADYIKTLDNGQEVKTLHGPKARDGLFFYSNDLTGLNFISRHSAVSKAIDAIVADVEDNNETTYVQSVTTDEILPDFHAQNPSSILSPKIKPRIWIGNQLAVQTHFDLSQNIACVVGGRRRFTVFPPDQVSNLYMGPMEHTPAGTPISLVRLDDVDYDRFPRFREAEKHALVAELEPGDAIFIPYLWWHHVQSLSTFNVLINYWWNEYEALGSPMDTLLHGILSFRDMSPPMRQAWKAMFDTYVFGDGEAASAHIPEASRGGLGSIGWSTRIHLWQSLARGVGQQADEISNPSSMKSD